LLEVLAEDVVALGDGGGKVPGASLQPLRRRDSVARLFMGSLMKSPPDRVWIEEVNGVPAIVAERGGRLQAILELDVRDGRVAGMYAVANPDKLQPLARHLGLRV
ncbi:MAG: hypothetical protein ACRDF8_02315, partial [Chloroflexota bacterium]